MPTKGFNVKTNLGGHQTIKTAFGTVSKNGPKLKPKVKPKVKAKAPKPTTPKPTLTNTAKPAPAAQPATGPRLGAVAAPDSLYNQQVDLANREGSQRLTDLGEQEKAIKYHFGLDDPTNPFSRANALKKSYLANMKGVSAQLASQGQLYAGAHERALARTRYNQEQALAELRQAYDTALNGISGQKASSQFQTEEQRNQAFQDWLNRAPEATDYEDAPEEGAAPASAASAKAAPSRQAAAPAPRPSAATARVAPAAPTPLPKHPPKNPALHPAAADQFIADPFGNRPKAKPTQKQQAAKAKAKQQAKVKAQVKRARASQPKAKPKRKSR